MSSGGRHVHQGAHVFQHEPPGHREDQRRDEQSDDRVSALVARADEQHPDQHRDGADQVGAKVERVGAQRRAAVVAGGAKRRERADDVDRDRGADHGEHVPGGDELMASARAEPVVRLVHDENAAADQDRRLAERGQVLRARVPVLVALIRRLARQPDREERQERGDDIAARLDPRGDQPEAAGDHARDELQQHQRSGREDRNNRGAVLGSHPRTVAAGINKHWHAPVSCRPTVLLPRSAPMSQRAIACRTASSVRCLSKR